MTTMVRKPASELEGAQLDWAVAKALGLRPIPGEPIGFFEWDDGSGWFSPSTEWGIGGPIVEREAISITCTSPHFDPPHRYWMATTGTENDDGIAIGNTPLIAAMRAFVASKLGDTVEVGT